MKKILYCMLIGAAVLSALPSCATVKTPGDAPLTLVTVRQGKVQGTLENGLGTFKAIPFAEAPVGDLRQLRPSGYD